MDERMKRHEAAYRAVLPRRVYSLLRLDGRSFHSYLRGCQRPYDEQFMTDMDAVSQALCAEVTGTAFAYTQSDEISLLVTDFATTRTEPWFGGVIAKQLSIAAALATAVLNERRPGKRALFDARVFALADPVEVGNYFVWRQRDATRNSISMAAQAHFSHRQLHGVSTAGMQELLWNEAGINWNDYPDACKRGRLTTRQTGEQPVTYVDGRTNETVTTTAMRSSWTTVAAPQFTLQPGGPLASMIPALPTLVATAGARPAPQP